MIDYDDVRLVASIGAAHSVARAAAGLGAHVATLYRRLRDLERRVGGALFERVDGRLLPTERAVPILEAADLLAARLGEVERRLAGRDDRLTGALAVTTADSLLPLACRCAHEFVADHPGVELTLAVGNSFADLGRREADLAIRPTRTPPETLIGRRAAGFDFSVYVRAGAAAETPGWIGFDGSMRAVPAARWLADAVPSTSIRLRVNSMWAAAEAASAGLGRAVLPAYLAEGRPLERVGAAIDELASEVWVLFHPDLRANPRVRAFADHAARWFKRELRAASPAEDPSQP